LPTRTQNLHTPTRTQNKHYFQRRPPVGSIRLNRLIPKCVNINFKGNNQRNINPSVFVDLLIYLMHLTDAQVMKHIKNKLKQI
jgi:hypothetical protein